MGAFDILFCVPMCLKVIFGVGASPTMSYSVTEFSIRECIPYVQVIKPTHKDSNSAALQYSIHCYRISKGMSVLNKFIKQLMVQALFWVLWPNFGIKWEVHWCRIQECGGKNLKRSISCRKFNFFTTYQYFKIRVGAWYLIQYIDRLFKNNVALT